MLYGIPTLKNKLNLFSWIFPWKKKNRSEDKGCGTWKSGEREYDIGKTQRIRMKGRDEIKIYRVQKWIF